MTSIIQRLDNSEPFDFRQIFIGREEQLAAFKRVLRAWQQVMSAQKPEEDIATDIPSPDNKLQGLVVMLYGRGGFGKSTLLYRFHGIAVRENVHNHFIVCDPIQWDSTGDEGRRATYSSLSGQGIDPAEYCTMLCARIAAKLGKESKDFRTFQQVVGDVERTKKEAGKVLDEVTRDPRDDRFKDIRGASVELVATGISSIVPGSKLIVENAVVKSGANAALKLSAEQAQHLLQRFRHRLGDRLIDLLDPAQRLAVALGSDLHRFALNRPLLIFFDTYEEIDEGDALLRVIMGAAGMRVGWVIAGRDNLWAGTGQRRRSIALEHGYKEIVTLNRSLSVNFNSEEVGAFTHSDIAHYFAKLCKLFPSKPPLPKLTPEELQRVLAVTDGIPLAVNIAASLYSETADLNKVTEDVAGRKEIIDQMVMRYLLHTRIDESERGKLYALALLRRCEGPALVTALGLSDEEAREPTRFDAALSHLHRRYSFIFTETGEPSLHQEVRKYLRLWLLERRTHPDIRAINEHLIKTHESALAHVEQERNYNTLKDRLQSEEWTDIYLDLVEQHYWLDPVKGLSYLLPFLIATSVYRREIIGEAGEIGDFFASCLHSQYIDWWWWTIKGLVSVEPNNGLEALLKLLEQKRLNVPAVFNTQREELEAVLWWLLGEAYDHRYHDNQALIWYEKALQYLPQEEDLKELAVVACFMLANRLLDEKKYIESANISTKTIKLRPDYDWAYNLRGDAYAGQQQYAQAIADYSTAIRLNPDYTIAYHNRAYVYLHLKNIDQARVDFLQATKLAPNDVNAACMTVFAWMGKDHPRIDVATQLETIAKLEPQSYVADICLAVASGLNGKLKEGLTLLELAIQKAPESEDAYFWKGMLSAYYYRSRPEIAVEAIERALELRLMAVLMVPLYWFEKDNPVFFERYAKPLLEKHGV